MANHPFLSEETRLLVEVRGSHPSTKNAEGWGTQLCGRVKFEKLRVRHPPPLGALLAFTEFMIAVFTCPGI
jgi:hypothetical protein